MKLKRLPEDFQVEEQASMEASGGSFALYRLRKQSLGTLEAVDAILEHWNIARSQVAWGGLKDKYALTTQYLKIQRGPRRGLSETNFELEYLGQTESAIHASAIKANRFVIVLRDLSLPDLESAIRLLAVIKREGLPNYFDNQRFGSLGQSGEFIARPWCLGDYERALWLALADDNVHDGPAERDEKRVLREHWNDWSTCQAVLRRSRHQNIINFLANEPADFRRAIALVRQDVRSLWLAAFQSHLWNQVLATLIHETCQPSQLSFQSIGRREVPFFEALNDDQRQYLQITSLPLPSARLHLPEGPLKEMYDKVLAAEGIEPRQVRVKYPRDSFFSKGERPAVVQAGNLNYSESKDDLYLGRHKLTLEFTLRRGSYATILVKRIIGTSDAEFDGASDALE